MGLPASGQISLGDVNIEMGLVATAQIAMNDTIVRGLFGVGSGQIRMSNGHCKANVFGITVATNAQNIDVNALALAQGWNGTAPVELVINSGVWVYSTNVSIGGLIIPSNMTNLSIINYGNITGMGGSAYQAGGHAITNSASGVTILNNSGAFIAGGGGGGAGVMSPGGGAGQSAIGQASSTPSSSSASYLNGPAGCCGGCLTYGTRNVGSGGPQGGGGADGANAAGCCSTSCCGLCGGGAFFHYPAGAQGGSVLSSTSNADGSWGGGGGWGRVGTSGGGAAGQAVNGTHVTLTNSGTVYGSVA